MAYRLARSRPNAAVSLYQAQREMTLFRVQSATDIPDKYRCLWLIEEAREGIAVTGMGLRQRGALLHPRAIATLVYQHIRIWLLLKAINRLEQATQDTERQHRQTPPQADLEAAQ